MTSDEYGARVPLTPASPSNGAVWVTPARALAARPVATAPLRSSALLFLPQPSSPVNHHRAVPCRPRAGARRCAADTVARRGEAGAAGSGGTMRSRSVPSAIAGVRTAVTVAPAARRGCRTKGPGDKHPQRDSHSGRSDWASALQDERVVDEDDLPGLLIRAGLRPTTVLANEWSAYAALARE